MHVRVREIKRVLKILGELSPGSWLSHPELPSSVNKK